MRRSKLQPAEITLFPFLSILICVIGVLAFVLMGVVVVGMHGEKKKIEIDISSRDRKKLPVFIDCQYERVIVYSEKAKMAEICTDREPEMLDGLVQYLHQSRQSRYAVLLVRPNGYSSCRRLRKILEKAHLEFGYEPVDEGWRLEFKEEAR